MSAFYLTEVKCPCGHSTKQNVARGINVERKPEFRTQILNGTFHRVKCPKCNQECTVEAAFSYADPKRNLFIQVRPRKQFFHWKIASDIFGSKVKRAPKIKQTGKTTLRVVFGLAELREKILCQDYGLDDRLLELMKVVLLYEHPFLMHRPRLQFVLEQAAKNQLVFRATHQHDKRHYQIVVPTEHVTKFIASQKKIESKMKTTLKLNNVFDSSHGHYMGYLRYMPETNALTSLAEFAQASRLKQTVNLKSAAFLEMLKKLPRVAHLTTDAKNDLRELSSYALKVKDDKTQARLWEVRFGKDLDPEYARNKSRSDIETLWRVFEELPDRHIEGNNKIREVIVSDIDWQGTYYDQTKEIEIDEDILKNRSKFQDTIRHEVGHGAHANNKKKVDDWLEQQFGWKSYDLTFNGMDRWVKEMGGWNGASAKEKQQVFRCFQQAFKGKNDEPGEVTASGKDHIWNRPGFLPRKAYDLSPAYWYTACSKYLKNGAKSKAFFLNYSYKCFYTVHPSTIDMIINIMPDKYAAVSDSEFFAELFAFHHNTEDADRLKLPKPVKKWLDEL